MRMDGKTGNQIADLEMNDLEDMGLVKLDVLGISYCDKIMGIRSILSGQEIEQQQMDYLL